MVQFIRQRMTMDFSWTAGLNQIEGQFRSESDCDSDSPGSEWMTCQGAGSPQYLKRYNQRRKYVSIKPETVPPTQDILGDFKAFLQKLENISWVKTVANTTGNFNKFASDISDLSEHEHDIHYLPTSSCK